MRQCSSVGSKKVQRQCSRNTGHPATNNSECNSNSKFRTHIEAQEDEELREFITEKLHKKEDELKAQKHDSRH